jgi:hypothetical protein
MRAATGPVEHAAFAMSRPVEPTKKNQKQNQNPKGTMDCDWEMGVVAK